MVGWVLWCMKDIAWRKILRYGQYFAHSTIGGAAPCVWHDMLSTHNAYSNCVSFFDKGKGLKACRVAGPFVHGRVGSQSFKTSYFSNCHLHFCCFTEHIVDKVYIQLLNLIKTEKKIEELCSHNNLKFSVK